MLTPNTRILVQGEGYKKLQDVNQTTAEIWNGTEYVNTNFAQTKLTPVKINFVGGNTIECDPNLEFQKVINDNSKYKNLGDVIKAKNLKKRDRILIMSDTPDFDFLSLDSFEYVNSLSSHEVGMMVATNLLFGQKNLELRIPTHEYTLRRVITGILNKAKVKFIEYEVYRRLHINSILELDQPFFLKEVSSFITSNGFIEEVWQSKPFLKGFIQVFFNTMGTEHECFHKKLNKNFAQEIQQALYLFGIRTKICKGLIVNHLKINKLDLFHMALKELILDTDRILTPLRNTHFDSFRIMHYRHLTLMVSNVTMGNKEVDMFNVNSNKFVANGLVAQGVK